MPKLVDHVNVIASDQDVELMDKYLDATIFNGRTGAIHGTFLHTLLQA